MRLERLDLTRFGRFTDQSLRFAPPEPGGPDLHVIYGPNEAGKSTLYAAWMDLLFGIPLQSRHAFLHPGPTLQIGARLSDPDLDLVRLKKTAASLQDAHGATLPEAVIQAALGGLTREGYGAMFSLDDVTLEKGGEAILSSRGDLGELLFSASAGLAQLAPRLEATRAELDAFHRPGGRKTGLRQAKEQIAALETRRRDLDVDAPKAQRLSREAQAAEAAFSAAKAQEEALRRAADHLRAALAQLPLRARAEALAQELAPLAHLPPARDDQARALSGLQAEEARLQAALRTRAELGAAASRRLSELPRDAALLAEAQAIAEASGLQGLHLAALTDLPKRRDERAEIAGRIAPRLARLGLTEAPEPLSAPRLAALRQLATRRETLLADLARAREEAARAAERLAALPPVAEAPQDPALAGLLAQLRAADPGQALTRATEDLALRQAEAARTLQALAPWRGPAGALAALEPPARWTLTDWEARDAATTRALTRAEAALLAAPQVRGVALEEVAEARARREAAWAAHRAALTAETAQTFEAALRRDDQLALHLAEAQGAAEAQAAAARSAAALREAEAARAALLAEIAAAANQLGLPGAGLADLKAWLSLRSIALEAEAARVLAEARARAATDAQAQAAAALAAALQAPPAPFALLLAQAQDRLDGAALRRQAVQARTEAQTEAQGRAARAAEAEAALASWERDWQAQAAGTPLATARTALGPFLDELDLLGQDLAEAGRLSARIAAMEANSARFLAASAAILTRLGRPDQAWPQLLQALTSAQQAEAAAQELTAEASRAEAARAEEQARLQALAGTRAALGEALAWDGRGTLAEHLAACLRARDLRAELAALTRNLQEAPSEPEASLQTRLAEVEAALTLAQAQSETLLASRTEARTALARIGADEAAARLASERENALNALAEAARAHLSLRLAVTGFDLGLRRYRDSHRSAMLARASDAFARLTLGAYRGLDAQAQGASERLLAIPARGGAKEAHDLSKGTRFQLYLALRIAGYHELARSRPPVPFIADDIMETFDLGRTEATFALLGEMARTGQVIYLTHHENLCAIAEKTCPGARLIGL